MQNAPVNPGRVRDRGNEHDRAWSIAEILAAGIERRWSRIKHVRGPEQPLPEHREAPSTSPALLLDRSECCRTDRSAPTPEQGGDR